MRLQKFMADCGVASRRACEQIISDGRVTVNGIPAEGNVILAEGNAIPAGAPAAEGPGETGSSPAAGKVREYFVSVTMG